MGRSFAPRIIFMTSTVVEAFAANFSSVGEDPMAFMPKIVSADVTSAVARMMETVRISVFLSA